MDKNEIGSNNVNFMNENNCDIYIMRVLIASDIEYRKEVGKKISRIVDTFTMFFRHLHHV